MRQRLRHLWLRLRTSYWLIPSVFAVGSVLLAVGAALLDGWLADRWPDELLRFFAVTVGGARSLLDTIAGSMITVAGVTFSITMVALSTASANYGPRLLESFRSDRQSQITLGVFIGTFLYCLLLLRIVVPKTDATDLFVPRIGIALAVLLTLASVAVLIAFVHHVVELLSISSLVARVGTRLRERIAHCFARLDEPDAPAESAELPSAPLWRCEGAERELDAWPWQVLSLRSGYIQRIDRDILAELAAAHRLRIALHVRTGDFVHERTRIASLATCDDDDPDRASLPPPETRRELERRIDQTIVFGPMRITVDDVELLVDQLIEVAQRALSPGINDPAVAMNAIDWLGAAMHELAQRQMTRRDARPDLVLEPTRDFDDYCELIFGALRLDIATSRNATLHTLALLGRLALDTPEPKRRARLLRERRLLLEAALRDATGEADVTRLRRMEATALEAIERRYGERATSQLARPLGATRGDDDTRSTHA